MTTNSAAAAAPDHALSRAELDQARLYLEQTKDGIIGAVKGLSEAQWAFKPAADRWSIAEIVEHVIFVQERILGPISDQLALAPPAPRDRDHAGIDRIVINEFPNRLTKFKAPEFSHPKGCYTRSEALDRLVKNYSELKEVLESTPDLREHALEALPLKAVSKGAHDLMDGYQWILTAGAHTERHTKQILEVAACPDFPEK